MLPLLALLALTRADSQLSISPAVVQNSGDQVVLSWSGVSSPTPADWIAFYSPADSEEHEWVGYVTAAESPTYEQGFGNISMPLLNLRYDYVFKYWQTDGYILLATSEIVSFANPNEPTQIHLSVTNNATEMRVMWVTNSSAFTPTVRYGLSPSGLIFTANGTTHTYRADQMCGGNANITLPRGGFRDPGQIHDVLLTDLQLGTQYYYQVGNDVEGFSAVLAFNSSKPVGPETPVRFIAYGDMGISPAPAATTTIQRAAEYLGDIDLLMHYGDIAYAFGNGLTWEQFFNLIEPVSRQIPYMVSIGNHEYDYTTGGENDPSHPPGNHGFNPSWGDYADDSNGECAVPVVNRFHMADATGLEPFWYSFNYGSVHYTVLSIEHNFTEGSAQYEWLLSDLASVNRSVTPWLILGFHRPMYFSEIPQTGSNKIADVLRSTLEPIFFENKVDLVLAGHLHAYQRTCPVYQGVCTPGAPVHVLLGMAGFALDPGPFKDADWSEYHDKEFGYTHIQVLNSTHLHFQYHHNIDDQIADDFWIVK